jgi:tetratricopeptide (TPR) repeat protein
MLINPPGSTLDTLGQRLRNARHERHMSQENLAQPEFTKSYVSAVERGKARPSLKALELMARRLDLPITELLALPAPVVEVPDLPALGVQLAAQLDQAELLINADRAAEGLRLINAAEQEHSAHLADLESRTRYHLAYLRALAYLRLAEPASARHELTTAMTLAQQMDDGEALEEARNLNGVAFFQQDMPRLALEQHEQCLQAVQNNVVMDPSLRRTIYSNLANDYYALNEPERAISVYEESRALLQNANNLEGQAATYSSLSAAQYAAGNSAHADRYAQRALNLTERARDLSTAAQMSVNLAALHVERKEYDEAEQLLANAQTLLQPTGNDLILGTVYDHYAALELSRGQLDRAADYAQQGLRLSEQAWNAQSPERDALARTTTLRAYAHALRTAGMVEEQRGKTEAADSLFTRALDLLDQAGVGDAGADIELTYAELLASRGAHEQASTHYRAAFRHRQRQAAR